MAPGTWHRPTAPGSLAAHPESDRRCHSGAAHWRRRSSPLVLRRPWCSATEALHTCAAPSSSTLDSQRPLCNVHCARAALPLLASSFCLQRSQWPSLKLGNAHTEQRCRLNSEAPPGLGGAAPTAQVPHRGAAARCPALHGQSIRCPQIDSIIWALSNLPNKKIPSQRNLDISSFYNLLGTDSFYRFYTYIFLINVHGFK